jgi:hypothetical protein
MIENDLLVILIENGRKRKKERKENKEKNERDGDASHIYKCEVFLLGISLGTNAPPHLYQMLCTGFNTWYK